MTCHYQYFVLVLRASSSAATTLTTTTTTPYDRELEPLTCTGRAYPLLALPLRHVPLVGVRVRVSVRVRVRVKVRARAGLREP